MPRMKMSDVKERADAEAQHAHLLYRALVAKIEGKLVHVGRQGGLTVALFDLDGALGGCVLVTKRSEGEGRHLALAVHTLDSWGDHWARRSIYNTDSHETKAEYNLAMDARRMAREHRRPWEHDGNRIEQAE